MRPASSQGQPYPPIPRRLNYPSERGNFIEIQVLQLIEPINFNGDSVH
jgi:hypothetical protein